MDDIFIVEHIKILNIAATIHGHANMGESIMQIDQKITEFEEIYFKNNYGAEELQQNMSNFVISMQEFKRKQLRLVEGVIMKFYDLKEYIKVHFWKRLIRLSS